MDKRGSRRHLTLRNSAQAMSLPNLSQRASPLAAAVFDLHALCNRILQGLRPSVMLRTTCKQFRDTVDASSDGPPRTFAEDGVANITVLRWALLSGLEPAAALTACVRSRKVEVLGELLRLYPASALRRSHCTMKLAAGAGRLPILECLQANGFRFNVKGTCSAAAGGGHLKTLRWPRKHGCPWHVTACSRAAEKGHLPVLRWLLRRGCPWDAYICTFAAEGGHLEVIKWAHANGSPWDETWARANGCPWDYRACVEAAGFGHLEKRGFSSKAAVVMAPPQCAPATAGAALSGCCCTGALNRDASNTGGSGGDARDHQRSADIRPKSAECLPQTRPPLTTAAAATA
ncbi:hypothetical protein JKP88DRAFT_299400 [Tribonema minus]|uniref:Ankyrin repeat protein n=1 Tax=Tribonema minus TaxID=303371 RepID=A0A836CKU3_9STRA|nr:hypothetical protein JKP88DRAFT_299400 [Tribonema minus]